MLVACTLWVLMDQTPDVIERLGDKEKLFCLEYLKDLAPGPAAQRAGYAKSYGTSLLQRDEIRAAVEYLQMQRASQVGIDVNLVLTEVLALAREARSKQLYSDATAAYKVVLAHLGSKPGDAGKGAMIQINIGRDERDEKLERDKKLDSSATLILGRTDGARPIQIIAQEPRA